MRAYYFSNKDKKLRYGDGRQIRKGRTHKVKGKPVLCGHGLHASKRAIDALDYAPDCYLWVVELGGDIIEGDDKVVATERTYVDGFDAEDLLREFARKQALINIEKIYEYCSKEDYDLIVEYLETGSEDIRSAAESAAWSARSAAMSAAESAASSAARAAARAAAMSAAESAASSAARSAARAAARAARSAAMSAAESAANDMLEGMIAKKLEAK